jgi:carbamoyltransferase
VNILGIGGYSHDSAAALVVDGQLVAAVAEERLSRVKHQGGPPRRAAEFCLRQAGLHWSDVDHVTAYMRPGLRLARRIPYRLGQALRSPVYSLGFIGYECVHNAQYVVDMRGLCGPRSRLHWMEHHPAHAASAFLASPFERAALLSIDYVGEWHATWMGIGEGTSLRPLRTFAYPNSLGVFYSAITDYLGFTRASDEYKVMGLASYGEPEFAREFATLVADDSREGYQIDRSWTAWHRVPGSRAGYFGPRFLARFGPPRRAGEPVEAHHANIAASAQRVLEDTVLRLAGWLHRASGAEDLCLAGGVALNCSMNGRLLREGPFRRIFIQPAAGDDGIALGGALQLHHALTGAPRGFEMRHARYGPGFDDDAIRAVLERTKTVYEAPPDLEDRAAELLAEGAILGWYQGRMEFGPRALGGRSILADPTRPDMKDLLNKFVKYREEFRPFAPSVLADRAADYFEGCGDSPFMLFVHPVRPERRAEVPAITHVDGTARVQTVTREADPRYYRLIERFAARRGAPMLLNTSFNVMGEPIVHTPEDALRCFASTGMDALAIGGFIVRKPRVAP